MNVKEMTEKGKAEAPLKEPQIQEHPSHVHKPVFKTFFVFLALITVWSFFFGAFKFFTWTYFQHGFKIRLEEIA